MSICGFIDLQVNGYAGVDFSDSKTTPEMILDVAEVLADQGTVGFLATVTTNQRTVIEHCVETITSAIVKQHKKRHILGIHLEGPFISSEYGYRGIHSEGSICFPDIGWFSLLQEKSRGNIRMVTLAPELAGALEFIGSVSPGVIASVGHSQCSFENVREAVREGLSIATHIGNGCRQIIDRHDNPIVNILACSELGLSFISDGFHLPEAFIRMILRSRPVEKLYVVSDAVKFAGMPAGIYSLKDGEKISLAQDGRLCLLSDPNVLAGSTSNMLKCMNNLAMLDVFTEDELYQIGCLNQMTLLKMDPNELTPCGARIAFDSVAKQFTTVK